jgi:site-specific DNA-methyltransferase (adenine-specific)
MIKPFYQEGGQTIYCGDARKILPELGSIETVITDPIWPNASVNFGIKTNPVTLFGQMCKALPPAQRLIVHLGCDSDPRFLRAVPRSWKFMRLCNLEYIVPFYKGRILYNGDIAYCFGVPPDYIPGRQLMTGGYRGVLKDKTTQRHTGRHRDKMKGQAPGANLKHPTPRDLSHVLWLVAQFSDRQVVDPFMGSGTTIVAAKRLGRQGIGIEINEEYCEVAVERLRQSVMELKIGDDRQIRRGQQSNFHRGKKEAV